ncbi:MoaD/ThiS family protein [Chloracidobacterium thermophilum]|uniref:MoaD/ThiS family protein n=1 Tax=Chloracidobacterium thermophilum TaxID=458033 RepID=UPI000738D52C|nr:MoaD/ThiS family protein [Chloracidobacterium thermophilum]
MAVTIELSSVYLPLTDNQRAVAVEATTVGEALRKLTEKYAKLSKEIYNGRGLRQPSVSIYVNSRDINTLDDINTRLENGDVVTVVPSVGWKRPYGTI